MAAVSSFAWLPIALALFAADKFIERGLSLLMVRVYIKFERPRLTDPAPFAHYGHTAEQVGPEPGIVEAIAPLIGIDTDQFS